MCVLVNLPGDKSVVFLILKCEGGDQQVLRMEKCTVMVSRSTVFILRSIEGMALRVVCFIKGPD